MMVLRLAHGHNMQGMILLALHATYLCQSLLGTLYGHAHRHTCMANSLSFTIQSRFTYRLYYLGRTQLAYAFAKTSSEFQGGVG